MADKILVVDDDLALGEILSDILAETGAEINFVTNGPSALETVEQSHFDLVLLDLLLPGINGMDVLKRLTKLFPETVVVIMSGHGTIAKAVEATKLGAYDFLEKPLEKERVLLTVRNALEKKKLTRTTSILLAEAKSRYRMVGVSAAMQSIFSLIDKVAPSNITVLITGETGTGKELIARAIHLNSLRASEHFVQVNCAAIPDELIESELFGHLKGSFTGAVSDRSGKFQQADKGSLFLDEVGDLSVRAQAKVLRAIETGEIARVGSQKTEFVDVRLIAATNRDLQEMVKQNAFREDLFHRLNVIPIFVSPLRERLDDIPPLIEYFMTAFCQQNNVPPKTILPDAEGLLMAYSWPGNVRELKNFVDKLMLLTENQEISSCLASHLLNLQTLSEELRDERTLHKAKGSFERQYVQSTLQQNNWNITLTAKQLDISRSQLYRIMEKHGIPMKDDVTEK
ncbi:MAG: sigma-54-dependent transcriptional regulator [bacterium]